MPRSKLLWLRLGNSRTDLWKFMEHNIFRELTITYIIIGAIILAYSLLGQITELQAFCCMLIIICCGQFYIYFSLACQIKPGVGNTILFITGMTASTFTLMFLIASSVSAENYSGLIIMSACLLFLGLSFRIVARNKYMSIDWLQVKPKLIKNKSLASAN